MKVSFLAECVTSLRYFFPIIRVLKSLGHDIEVFYPIDGAGLKKYNSSIRNLQTFAKRINQVFPDVLLTPAPSDRPPINTDILFTLECIPRGLDGVIFNYDKKFCIQHGTDYTNFIQYVDDKTTYITHDKCFQDDLKQNFGINAICPDVPVAFWDINTQLKLIKSNKIDINNKNIAYIFYPDHGYKELAKKLVLYLSELGLTVIIKQRRKHQSVENLSIENVCMIYDDIWYPSEAVALPAISSLCIGFSSAAYADLAAAGINYIDLAIEPYSKCRSEAITDSKWPGYIKPKDRDNFHYLPTENFEVIQERLSGILKNNITQKFENNNTIGEKFLENIL